MKPTPKKILIVEDELALLSILEEKFKAEGFMVTLAENGEEGLKAAEKENPDIILLDLAMPKMDGLAMAKALREKKQNTPIIVLTNLDDAEHVSNVLALGSFDYLVKSDWKLEDVVMRVKQKLGM